MPSVRLVAPVASPVALAPEAEFESDMVEFFRLQRRGHIARHGYPGEGGKHYAQWLADHDIYRSRVTLAEIELITAYTETLAQICGNTKVFVEGGVGSVRAFRLKTERLLLDIARKRGTPPDYKIADVARQSYEEVRQYIADQQLPFKPEFIEGNFFASLPVLGKDSAVYIPGITFTNIPEDMLARRSEDVFADTFSYFGGVLANGGVLIFTYANDNGIGRDGKEIKAFYDHPLIHEYQHWIFQRVANELTVTGDYRPENFRKRLRFEWRADNHVLTRHVGIISPARFRIGNRECSLPRDFDGYMGNNQRPPDDLIRSAAERAGASEVHILGLSGSNIRLAALVFG